jgi:hypothetical protein
MFLVPLEKPLSLLQCDNELLKYVADDWLIGDCGRECLISTKDMRCQRQRHRPDCW